MRSGHVATQPEDWAGEMGERWLAHLDRFESMIAPVGDALLRRAVYASGERVLDVGCGGGASSLAIARAVHARGQVTGVDISPLLVAEGTRRAAAAGLDNLCFKCADAATVNLPAAPFDRLHSRFGSMFFADPPAAFTNLANLLRGDARADFAVWAPARDNPWVSGVLGILRSHIDLPHPEPRAPGPFALDDPDYFGTLLRQAGFAELDFSQWRGKQPIGGAGVDANAACDFVLNAMSFGDLLQQQDVAIRASVTQQMRALFSAHATPRGIEMEAAAWLVSARRR